MTSDRKVLSFELGMQTVCRLISILPDQSCRETIRDPRSRSDSDKKDWESY